MDRLKSSIKISVLAVFAVIALLAMIYSLSFGGWKALSVQTGSMKPAIDPGDLVLVKKVPASEIKIGDVITYVKPGDENVTVTHRVVQVLGQENGPKSFVTRGDANATADAAVPQSSVVGAVSHQIPFMGHAVDFVRKPIGLILIIYIPALAIIIGELRRLSAYYKSQIPYVAEGYTPHDHPKHHSNHRGALKSGAVALLIVSAAAYPVGNAFAALQTTVTLTGNTITSPGDTPTPPDPEPEPPTQTNCTITNNNNVNVSTNSSQTATTGGATTSNNTNGGSATSGDATNSNSTNVNVGINNQNGCPANTPQQ